MSKFKDVFANLKNGSQEPATSSKPAPIVPQVGQGQGRPKNGKRSDPNYKQTTCYLKKETLKEVQQILIGHDDMDFSDLVQGFLESWVKQQQANQPKGD